MQQIYHNFGTNRKLLLNFQIEKGTEEINRFQTVFYRAGANRVDSMEKSISRILS